MNKKSPIEQFQLARKDDSLVVIEGLHALKHALRFGAKILNIYTNGREEIIETASSLAPDIVDTLETKMKDVPNEVFSELSARTLYTKVAAIAERPKANPSKRGRIIYLDNPRNLGNVGAVVRVAAAAGAGAIAVSGDLNPWHPVCVGASAGLHFAIPVIHTMDGPSAFGLPVIVLDPEGQEVKKVPKNCVMVFGSERKGVSEDIKNKADKLMRIPMKEKVSSLNLATSVAVVLYCS